MRRTILLSSSTLLALWTTTGCVALDSGDSGPADNPGSTGQRLLMTRAQSCGELDEALREDARLRLADEVSLQQSWDDGDGFAVEAEAPRAAGTGGTSSVDTGDSVGEANASHDYSTTNTQVAGIDEADIIKTDGENAYVLRDSELVVARAWPADEMSVLADQIIEGSTREMFVVGGPEDETRTVVVYSTVDATSLYDEADLEPPIQPDRYYPAIECWDCGYYYPLPATKVTVLALTGSKLAVQKELYYEGLYVSSRRNGEAVRTTLQVPSRTPFYDPYGNDDDQVKAMLLVLDDLDAAGKDVEQVPAEELGDLVDAKLGEIVVARYEAEIETITHEDWLPRTFVRTGDGLEVQQLPCDSFYLPLAGSTQPGITLVAEMNLGDLGDTSNDVAVLGVADTMYENADKVVLTSGFWDWSPDDGSTIETVVHQFDVTTPGQIAYEASTTVAGYLNDQFSIDERDGFLRLVTTTEGSSPERGWTTANHVFVLQADDGEFETVGSLEDLAEDESVQSVRYVGDKVYIVTFRQMDPLFVVDLADPTTPTLLGELHIPGFSEYMHPLDADHLLTIGRDADEETGWAENIALQIFDVSDALAPQLLHKHVFTEMGASSAEQDHKAFNFFPSLGLLALPFFGETYDEAGYWQQANTLELFEVSIEDGFAYLGALDGNVLLSEAEQDGEYYCSPYTYGSVERGMFIDDTLYAVGRRGLIASSLDEPAEPVGVLPFGDLESIEDRCWDR